MIGSTVKEHTDLRWNDVSVDLLETQALRCVAFDVLARKDANRMVSAETLYKMITDIYRLFWEMKLDGEAAGVRAKTCSDIHDLVYTIESDWSENVLSGHYEEMGYVVGEVAIAMLVVGKLILGGLDGIEDAQQ